MKHFLLLALMIFPKTAGAFLEYNATFSFENRNFILNRSGHSLNDMETIEGNFRFTLDNEKNFLFKINPHVKVDFFDPNRNRYLPLEAFFMIYSPNMELTAGLEMIRWGVANSFNPTDIVNRSDFEDFYYDPERLAELTATFKGTIDHVGPFSETTFFFGLLPYFQETDLPESNSRFSLDGSAGGIPYTLMENQLNPDYQDSLGGFFKLSTTLKSLDFSLHYYHGLNHNPGFLLVIDDNGALRLRPFYYKMDMTGLNITAPLGNFELRLESALVITSANSEKPHDIDFEDNNAIPSNHLQFVPGVDYTFHDIGRGDLKLSIEYLGENNHATTLRYFRPFKNDLFGGIEYSFNNAPMTQIKGGVIKDLGNHEMAGQLEFSSKLYKELKLEIEGIWVIRDPDAQTPFSIFENNSSVMARLSTSFGGRFK